MSDMTKEQAAAAIGEILKPFRVEGRDQWERDEQMLEIIATVFHDIEVVFHDIEVCAVCVCPQCFVDSIDDGVSVDGTDGEPTNAILDVAATILACATTVDEAIAQAEHLRTLRDRRTQWQTQEDIDLRYHIDQMLWAASI